MAFCAYDDALGCSLEGDFSIDFFARDRISVCKFFWNKVEYLYSFKFTNIRRFLCTLACSVHSHVTVQMSVEFVESFRACWQLAG